MTGSKRFFVLKILLLLLSFLMPLQTALADRIDGGWCNSDGQRIHIDGSQLQLPGGRIISGQYDRHNFSYTDSGTKEAVRMNQQSEELMLMFRGDGSKAEKWQRCEAIS